MDMPEYNEYNQQPAVERPGSDEETLAERGSDESYNEGRSESTGTPIGRIEDPHYRERRYDPDAAGERPYEEVRNQASGATIPPADQWWRTWRTRRGGCLLPLLILLGGLLLGALLCGTFSGPHSLFANPLHTMLCGGARTHMSGRGSGGHKGDVRRHPRPASGGGSDQSARGAASDQRPAPSTPEAVDQPNTARPVPRASRPAPPAPPAAFWCQI